MKKMTVCAILGCMILGSAGLSACSAPVSQPVMPEVIQVQTVQEEDNKVSLTGKETVEVVPDRAEIRFTVRTEKKTAEDCQQENAENLNQLVEYLKQAGFEEESIKTSGFSLNPQYDWSSNVRTLIGYEMRTTVQLTDVLIEQVGEILTDAVTNGANEIDSVSYYSSEYDQAYNQALAGAIALSRSKGEALAAASGKTLGGVLNITEISDNQIGRYVDAGLKAVNGAAMEMAADRISMDVMPGEMQVTAEIMVEFELVDSE